MPAEPLEPEVADALEAIEATLHGEPTDPRFAELAELSLILRADRPEPAPAFASRLDREVAGGFPGRGARRERPRWLGRRVWVASLTGAATIAAAVVLAVVLVHGSSGPGRLEPLSGAVASTSASASSAGGAGSAGGASSGGASSAASSAGGSVKRAAPTATAPSRSLGTPAVPRSSAGRRVAQTAHLALAAGSGQIDGVAREIYRVIGTEHGYVSASHVFAERVGTSTARFTLEVPVAALQRTLDRLSQLRGARVLARSDNSQDLTARIDGAGASLTQAQALRQSLLGRLADAETAADVQSAERQLRRNRTAIARDQTELAQLRHRVHDSKITISVQAPPAPAHGHRHAAGTGGLSLGRGLHDAGRVLVVAAAVALIVLAVLVPLSLLAGIAAWVTLAVRRRRREHALEPRP